MDTLRAKVQKLVEKRKKTKAEFQALLQSIGTAAGSALVRKLVADKGAHIEMSYVEFQQLWDKSYTEALSNLNACDVSDMCPSVFVQDAFKKAVEATGAHCVFADDTDALIFLRVSLSASK